MSKFSRGVNWWATGPIYHIFSSADYMVVMYGTMQILILSFIAASFMDALTSTFLINTY